MSTLIPASSSGYIVKATKVSVTIGATTYEFPGAYNVSWEYGNEQRLREVVSSDIPLYLPGSFKGSLSMELVPGSDANMDTVYDQAAPDTTGDTPVLTWKVDEKDRANPRKTRTWTFIGKVVKVGDTWRSGEESVTVPLTIELTARPTRAVA